MEKSLPIHAIICWYATFEEISKRKIQEKMSDLFERLPRYQKEIEEFFENEGDPIRHDEVLEIGPADLISKFGELRKEGVITFKENEEMGKYVVDETKLNIHPKFESYIVSSEDLGMLMNKGLDSIIARAEAHNTSRKYCEKEHIVYISRMGTLLKAAEEARNHNMYAFIVSELPLGYDLSAVSKISFDLYNFVSDTRDYNQAYVCLVNGVNSILPESKKDIENFKIPGFAIEKNETQL